MKLYRFTAILFQLVFLTAAAAAQEPPLPVVSGQIEKRETVLEDRSRITCEYQGDQKHGREEILSPKGKLRMIGWYEHGKRSGTWQWFTEEGAKIREAAYAGDLPHGPTTTYFPGGGKQSEITYERGQPAGPQLRWYENGRQKEVLEHKYGKKHGMQQIWDEQGRLTYEAQWLEDLLHGTETSFYANGKICTQVVYHLGKKKGEETEWYESGGKKAVRRYKDGKRDGPGIEFDPQGLKTVKSEWRDDKPHGTWTHYYPSQRPRMEQLYDEGVIKHTKKWDENGQVEPQDTPDPYIIDPNQ